jgi:hypothetical protein
MSDDPPRVTHSATTFRRPGVRPSGRIATPSTSAVAGIRTHPTTTPMTKATAGCRSNRELAAAALATSSRSPPLADGARGVRKFVHAARRSSCSIPRAGRGGAPGFDDLRRRRSTQRVGPVPQVGGRGVDDAGCSARWRPSGPAPGALGRPSTANPGTRRDRADPSLREDLLFTSWVPTCCYKLGADRLA